MPLDEPVNCEPEDVAKWIGLANASLLGSEPIYLESELVERLKLHGARTELTAAQVSAILRTDRQNVARAARVGVKSAGARLGHRKVRGKLFVTAGDLAAFIQATNQSPVPASGQQPSRAEMEKEGRDAVARIRAKYRL